MLPLKTERDFREQATRCLKAFVNRFDWWDKNKAPDDDLIEVYEEAKEDIDILSDWLQTKKKKYARKGRESAYRKYYWPWIDLVLNADANIGMMETYLEHGRIHY